MARRRPPEPDGPHRYIGPTTKWGLMQGTPCAIVGHKAGGVIIQRAADRRRFVVARRHVVKRSEA